MNYSSASVLIFPSESTSVNTGITFATTDQGSLTGYASLSPASLMAVGKITPKVAFAYTTGNMSFDAGADFVLVYSDPKYEPSNADVNAGITYNIFSDLQLGFSVSAAIDVTGGNTHNYNAKLNLSLAF